MDFTPPQQRIYKFYKWLAKQSSGFNIQSNKSRENLKRIPLMNYYTSEDWLNILNVWDNRDVQRQICVNLLHATIYNKMTHLLPISWWEYVFSIGEFYERSLEVLLEQKLTDEVRELIEGEIVLTKLRAST